MSRPLVGADGRQYSRDVVNTAAKALIAAHGMKDPVGSPRSQERWRLRRLKKARDRLEAELAARPNQGVYIIGSVDGPVKIGIAIDPHKRLAGLQTGHPEKLKLFEFFPNLPAGVARQVEQECHRRAYSQRMNGEWFDMDWEEAAALVRDTMPKLGIN